MSKAYGKNGGELWVILGNRSGANRADWRRVYKSLTGREHIRFAKGLVNPNCINCRKVEIMQDGEIREA